jgi:hypothetical protein
MVEVKCCRDFEIIRKDDFQCRPSAKILKIFPVHSDILPPCLIKSTCCCSLDLSGLLSTASEYLCSRPGLSRLKPAKNKENYTNIVIIVLWTYCTSYRCTLLFIAFVVKNVQNQLALTEKAEGHSH